MANKVLIISNGYLALSYRRELIIKLIEEGYDVFISIPKSEKTEFFTNIGCKIIDTPIQRRGINPFKDMLLVLKYTRIMKKIDPDVVLTYTIKPNVYGTFAASIYKKPIIINITGVGSAFAASKLRYIASLLYKYACRKAYFVFFQNESNYSLFVSNKFVEPNKTKVIPGSGVNIERFKPVGKQSKDEIIKFLFIGRIMKEKGIEEYLQTADIITKKYPNTEFQILGMFEEEKYRDVILINENPRIKYLGISDDVRNEIKEVDCIINPTYHEGMSNVLLEGAAMGKPLISSNIPGCKEIIDDGINGYLFEARNVKQLVEKIEKFLSLDDEAKNQMGQAGRKKIEKEFDRNIVINEYIKVIEDVIHRRLHT